MSFGKTLVDMVTVAGYIRVSSMLAMRGVISAEAVALGALALIVCLIFTRHKPLTFKSLRWRVVLPALSFYHWVQDQGHGDSIVTDRTWQAVLTLLIALFGIYFMLSGIFRQSTNED